MRIISLTIRNFRCFGPDPVTIPLGDTTCFVGSNGSGKTAALVAMNKMFSIVPAERQIEPVDFYVPPGMSLREITEPKLSIEAVFDFPEFDNDKLPDRAIAECFRQMVVADVGKMPHCRIRLEATLSWSTAIGEIDSKLYWVLGDRPEDLREVRASERGRIQVLYIPAYRDPSRQLRQTSGTVMNRLISSIDWPKETRKKIEAVSEDIGKELASVKALEEISKGIAEDWKGLNADSLYGDVQLQPITSQFEDLIRSIDAAFRPSPGGHSDTIDKLSDGQRSLFYLGLIVATVRAYERVREGKSALNAEKLLPPSLCVLAFEEPESHLAPHYSGRVARLINELAAAPVGQAVITTHSPSFMRRMDPGTVRYFRLSQKGTCEVRRLILPSDPAEEEKYVRLAVMAHPELYFAKAVVLVEGDSEEIVIPLLLEVHGLAVDPSFISVVPLAGRYVNHFWRLLAELGIPHVTLLDYDREREGGGWGRIKYAVRQLEGVGHNCADVLARENDEVVPDEEVEKFHTRPATYAPELQEVYCSRLEKYNVFFSAPLDIDFLLLENLPDRYRAVVQPPARGPVIPEDDAPDKGDRDRAVLAAVLKSPEATGETYSDEQKQETFYWYRYLFLGHSKPVSHRLAFSSLEAEDIDVLSVTVLGRVVLAIKNLLASTEPGGGDATNG